MSWASFIAAAFTFGPELRRTIVQLVRLWRDDDDMDAALKARRARELADRIEILARQRL
jgi:hypothetical protein